MSADASVSDVAGELGARMSADKKRCELSMSSVSSLPEVGLVQVNSLVRLTREETFKLGQTLLLMTGSMEDG